MTAVGVRELKNRLSRYLRRVRAGERLVVTERGEPIAVIWPAPITPTSRDIDRLLAGGLARWAGGKPRGSRRPPRVKGPTVAQAVLEGRR